MLLSCARHVFCMCARPSGLRADSRVPLVVIPEEQCRIKREAKQKMRSSTEQRSPSSPHLVTSTESSECALSLETRELISRIVAIDSQFAAPSNDSLMQLSVRFFIFPLLTFINLFS